MPHKTIKEMSERYGISPRTLRFWEGRGLIAPERVGTRRLYHWRDECRVRLILLAKRCGLSLDEAFAVITIPNWRRRKECFRVLCRQHLARIRREEEEAAARRARVHTIVQKLE